MDIGELVKDAPIPIVGGLTLYGVQLNDLVLIATFVYTMLRLAKFIINWWKEETGG